VYAPDRGRGQLELLPQGHHGGEYAGACQPEIQFSNDQLLLQAGTTYCAKWNIVSKDQTTGKKTTLSKTPSDGQIWNWPSRVMEIYGVTECSDFPKGNKSTVFTTQVYDQNLNVISSPSWTAAPAGTNTKPKCGYGLTVAPTQETLKY